MILNCHNRDIILPCKSSLDWQIHTSGLNPGQLIILHWQLQAGANSYLTFFKDILSSSLIQSIKVLSPSATIGEPWAASSFTFINPPVLSTSLALPAWLNTFLCFLRGLPGLFLCYHLHTPQVLWLTEVLSTFLPCYGLLIKKVWANKIIKEIMSSKCIRQKKFIFSMSIQVIYSQVRLSKPRFWQNVSTTTVILDLVLQGKFKVRFTELDNPDLLLNNCCFNLCYLEGCFRRGNFYKDNCNIWMLIHTWTYLSVN